MPQPRACYPPGCEAAEAGTGEAGGCWGPGPSMAGNMEPGESPGSSEGGMPKGRGSSGIEEMRIRSNSDSCSRLVLARRFWNQIFT